MKFFSKCLSFLLVILTASLCACSPVPAQSESTVFAMDTVMTLKVFGDNADDVLSLLEKMIEKEDALLSVTDEKSDIAAVNRSAGETAVDPETAAVLSQALSLCADTGGYLDVTVYPLVRAWGFTAETYRIPDEEEIESLLSLVDYTKVSVDSESNTVSHPDGMMLDLGAVAKGRLADLGRGVLEENGVASALLNLGGTILAFGRKPDGSKWKVGIADPENPGAYFGFIETEDRVVATSGGYERYFEGEDGVTYTHLISPFSGEPLTDTAFSVTAVCEDGLTADALSTAFSLMAFDPAIDDALSYPGAEFVEYFNGTVYITEGLSASFTLADGYEDVEVVVV